MGKINLLWHKNNASTAARLIANRHRYISLADLNLTPLIYACKTRRISRAIPVGFRRLMLLRNMLLADRRAFFIIFNIVMDLSCEGKFLSLDLEISVNTTDILNSVP